MSGNLQEPDGLKEVYRPKPKRTKVFDGKTTTDSYADSIIITPGNYEDFMVWIRNTGSANAIKYKWLGTVDGTNWEELQAETGVNAEASTYETNSEPWWKIKVQIKSSSSGDHSTVDCWIVLK